MLTPTDTYEALKWLGKADKMLNAISVCKYYTCNCNCNCAADDTDYPNHNKTCNHEPIHHYSISFDDKQRRQRGNNLQVLTILALVNGQVYDNVHI